MKSKKAIRMILIVLGVVVFLLVFEFGYKPMAETNSELTDQKLQLQTEVDQLRILWAQKENKKNDTEELIKKSETAVEGIPSYVAQEDQILYVQGLESDDFEVNAMSMAPSVDAYKFNVNFLNQEYAGQSILNTQLTINYKGTYEELKKICAGIQKSGNKESIQSIEMSYDQDTGRITGTLVINQYSRIGDTSLTYFAPIIDQILQGRDSVFGEVSTGSSGSSKGTNNSNSDQPQLP